MAKSKKKAKYADRIPTYKIFQPPPTFVQTFVACDLVIQEKGNKFSAINIFDSINLPTLPASYPVKFFLQLITEPGRHNVSFSYLDTSKHVRQILEFEQDIAPPGRFTTVVEILLEFHKFGTHIFHAQIDDNIIGFLPITLNQRSTPTEPKDGS